MGNIVLGGLEARVDDGARLVGAAVVDGVAVGDIRGALGEGEVGGEEEEEGGDGLESKVHCWLVSLGGRGGKKRSPGVSWWRAGFGG